jgi:hypothetical protein
MPDYMLLLYQPDAEEGEGRPEDRWAEMPVWLEVTESLRRGTPLTDPDPDPGPAGGAR